MSSNQGTTKSERKQGGGGGPAGMTTKEFSKSKKSAAQAKYEAQLKAGKKEIQSKIDRERYGAGVAYGSGKISKDKITDVEMFGGKASQYTNQYLERIGEAKKGSQNPDGSWNYNLTSKGWKMKYGSYTPGQIQTGSAMGTGDPRGIMTGAMPISQAMWQSQKNMQRIMKLGPLGLLSQAAQNEKGYTDYLQKFYATRSGQGKSSLGLANQGKITETQGSGFINVNERDASGGELVDAGTVLKKKKKIAGSGADTIDDSRSLFAKSNRTIQAKMV